AHGPAGGGRRDDFVPAGRQQLHHRRGDHPRRRLALVAICAAFRYSGARGPSIMRSVALSFSLAACCCVLIRPSAAQAPQPSEPAPAPPSIVLAHVSKKAPADAPDLT